MIPTARLRDLSPLIMPATVLVLAGIALFADRWLPFSVAGLSVFGPYTALVLGTGISVWFNRGRAFITLMSLLLAYTGYRLALQYGGPAHFPAKAVFTVACVFVPLNISIALLLPERGISHFRNYRWLLLLAAETLLAAWIAGAGRTALAGTAWHAMFGHWLLKAQPVPFLGRSLVGIALVVAIMKAWSKRSPLDIGLAGAIVAFTIACQWPGADKVFGMFMTAAGTIVLLAVMQESHHMAFRDELTDLPSRRALEERLVALGPAYVIAMVDVDHFKKFNDTYGHDVGDQVLKLVGARLAEIDGGGKAFRYGGEEFAVLFPEKKLKEALPHLEALRQEIESYRMTARTEQRRRDSRPGQDRRTTPQRKPEPSAEGNALRAPDQVPSVTVSIGVAERTELLDTPAKVIHAADQALYRAKESGRNRVSR